MRCVSLVVTLVAFLFVSRPSATPVPPYTLLTVEPTNKVTSILILLHAGSGRARDDLRFVERLATKLPNTKFVLPQAPTHTDAQWFSSGHTPSVSEIQEATYRIATVARAQATQHDLDLSRVGLFGWSEGGSLALSTCLRFHVGACIDVSGPWINAADRGVGEAPILLLHGLQDSLVPLAAFTDAERLKKVGRKASMITYPSASHMLMEVSSSVVEETATFLQASFT